MNIRSGVVLALSILLAASPASANQPAGDIEAWRTFAATLEPGSVISITLRDGHRLKGHFIQLSGDSVRVKPRTRVPVAPVTLSLSDIELMERSKEGWSAGRKVVTGVGVAAGVLTLWVLSVLAAYD